MRVIKLIKHTAGKSFRQITIWPDGKWKIWGSPLLQFILRWPLMCVLNFMAIHSIIVGVFLYEPHCNCQPHCGAKGKIRHTKATRTCCLGTMNVDADPLCRYWDISLDRWKLLEFVPNFVDIHLITVKIFLQIDKKVNLMMVLREKSEDHWSH